MLNDANKQVLKEVHKPVLKEAHKPVLEGAHKQVPRQQEQISRIKISITSFRHLAT